MKWRGLNLKGKYLLTILLIGAVLVNVKSIFVDFDVDSEYAVAMSYRMILGDRMFMEMWEPHQTSAFLSTFFMKLYLMISGTTTGVAIFLQSVGVVFQGLIAGLVYLVLKKRTDSWLASLISIFFLTVRPKEIVFPEFSNMQIWFSVLLFLCLIVYLENQKKKSWLFLGSICLCLEIISYPSCLVVYGIVLLLLILYAQEKVKDCLLFSGACFLQGCSYILFFAARIGLTPFLTGIRNIVEGDPSHQGDKRWNNGYYFFEMDKVAIWLLGCFLAAVITCFFITAIMKKRRPQVSGCWKRNVILIFFGYLFVTDGIAVLWFRERFVYAAFYLLAVCIALAGKKLCSQPERRIVITGLLISFGSLIGTMLLTNLDFLSVLRYLVLAGMVSFIPAARLLDKYVGLGNKLARWGMLFAFCLVMLFRRGGMAKTINGLGCNLSDLSGIVRAGPGMGLVTDYMGAYMENASIEDWKKYVRPGDRIFIIGTDAISTFGYLYEDTVVSAPSTICTPVFHEKTLEYWEQFPEKYPDLVIVPCWYGELRAEKDSQLMKWIEEEFQPDSCQDGVFWRFYRVER